MNTIRLPATLASAMLALALLPQTASAAPTTLDVDPVPGAITFADAYHGHVFLGLNCSGLVDGTSPDDPVFLAVTVSQLWGNGEYSSSASGTVAAFCDGTSYNSDVALEGAGNEIFSGPGQLSVALYGPNSEPQYGQTYSQSITVIRADDSSPTPSPTPTASPAPSLTPTPTPSATSSPTPTPTPTSSPTPTQPPAPVKAPVSLTTDASPETVTKGKKITVKGTLRRDGKKFKASTVLQFAADGDGFHKVKTVKSSSKGALKTTVTATKSGSFRYTFAGNSTTKPGTSASDHLVVKAKPKPKPKPKTYKNCTALVKVYPHGVGKSGAKDKGGDVTDFTRDNKTYAKNKKSDRDKDGIACER